MIYTSIDNNRIKEVQKLQTKKSRDITSTFIVEGEHLVYEAHKAGLLNLIIKMESHELEHNYDIEILSCNLKVMRFLSELDNPSKVIGVCNKKQGSICGNKILVLDNIQDPGNLGTIIKIPAVAFNVDTLILSEDCVDLYNSKVIRGSQGMIFNCNIVIGDLKEIITSLNGYTVYGTKVDGGIELKTISNDKKQVIIMGNEGNGLKKEILDLCDKYLYLKMNTNCESLNVAVATSIILYELDK